jgi:hypothetical protein
MQIPKASGSDAQTFDFRRRIAIIAASVDTVR